MPRRALIIEDHADTATALALLLKAHGYEVVIAPDGSSAIVLARNFQPSVAICDVGLPGEVDGYRVAEIFRSTTWGQGVRMIAMTGHSLAEDRQRARSAGFDVHLQKPASSQELLAHLGADHLPRP